MYNWEKQFELIRQGVAFVHATVSSNGMEPFDIVVRMRMVRDPNNCPTPGAFLPVSARQIPLTVCAMLAVSQDVHLAVPRLLSHRVIPDGVVMAMGYWAVLEPNRFTVSRPSSPACKESHCKQRLQVFWRDWVYAGSQSSIAKLAQVARGPSYMLNLTTRCLGLCQEEQTVLQLQALGVHLSPLGWRNISIQRLSGSPHTVGRLAGGGKRKGPCTPGRTVLSIYNKPEKTKDAEEDIYVAARPPVF